MLNLFKSLAVALKGKGPVALMKRVWTINTRLGLTGVRMDRYLGELSQLIRDFDADLTIFIPANVLDKHSTLVHKYYIQGVEFGVHGNRHVDHSLLTLKTQRRQLRCAQETFGRWSIKSTGFRAPYLRSGPNLSKALEITGFSYDSSRTILWQIENPQIPAHIAEAAYKRIISFCDPLYADTHPALPQIYGRLVEIPVSLPDDEILIDRLGGGSSALVENIWLDILSQTYRRGEVFTIQLHPERATLCAPGLAVLLDKARTFTPPVWITSLNEVAAWWRSHADAVIDIQKTSDSAWRFSVKEPVSATILARDVEVYEPTSLWADGYWQVAGATCTVQSPRQPIIGASQRSAHTMVNFLRQQGYIVQIADDAKNYSIYLDREDFTLQDHLSLLAQIEERNTPLVRLSRWPGGAKSALCITGDLDAVTALDYFWRLTR
jgi:peptidoglycan/xylan/chitin deacetylase (PgdA/CDA1 family)